MILPVSTAPIAFLAGGERMGEHIRNFDWQNHPLGVPPQWPAALQTATAIMLSAKQAMFVAWGADHAMLYNDAYAQILGDKHPAALGRPLLQVWSEVHADLLPIIEQTYAGQPVQMGDMQLMVHRHGYLEEAHFAFSYTPLRDAQGSVAGIFCPVVETTAQVMAERRRDHESLRQRKLFQAAPGFIAIVAGPRHVFEFVNDAYVKLFGHYDYLGRTAREVLPASYRQGLLDWLGECYRSGQRRVSYDTPIKVRGENGVEQRFLDIIYEPIRDDDGQVTGIFVEGQDVTEKHHAREALRASESQFSALAQGLPIAVWIAAPSGALQWFNAQSHSYSGYSPADLASLTWDALVHPEDLAQTRALWRRVVVQGGTYEGQSRLRRRDGSYRWHLSRAVPVRSVGGEVLRWVGTSTDVHDQQVNAQRLHEQNETLERNVAEAEEQLRQAQKMEAVGQLTGGIAHDFNNLLTGIIGSLEMMTKRISQGRHEALERYIGAALGSAERAASLTHRLLAFGRRQPLDPREVNARQLIVDMAELLNRTLGPLYELRLHNDAQDPLTFCDPSQLESAILNLAINARDAMPAGGRLLIETSTVQLDRPRGELHAGAYVRIAITDNGVGMTAEVLKQAIEPFFTTKPLGQGTGLGLSMVYGFARQSEGHLLIESNPGHGTTVEIYLPRSMASATPAMITDVAPRSFLTGKQVAVVEDEPVIRELILELLSDLDIQTCWASDGLSGLDLLRSAVPLDLMITDIGLPGLNGRDLAERARATRPGLKVLFITGYAENAALAQGFMEPGMEMLTKPFSVNELKAIVVSMLAS
jgi:PAS domain S-box-containing protein